MGVPTLAIDSVCVFVCGIITLWDWECLVL